MTDGFGDDGSLNPAQQEVLDQLGATADRRPEFSPELRYELRGELESALHDHVMLLGEQDTIYASKHAVAAVHGCETKFLAEQEFPGWSVPLVKGTVVHKAIELAINWRGQPFPGDLVDESLASLEFSDSELGRFLQEISAADRAQLRGDAVDLVTKFDECWPKLDRKWRPVTESKVRLELFGQRVVIQGKIDLTLGRANGLQAGKVLVDLKSGTFRPQHLEDLRHYAVIEAIRVGVPPRRLASYYLDQGRFHAEDVSEDLLFAAAARAADAVKKMIELHLERKSPTLIPGPQCRWCAIGSTCETGQRHLNTYDDPLEELL